MITVKTNLQAVADIIAGKLAKLADREYLLRPVAFDVINLMTRRIHIQGTASDGNKIGLYSPGYLAYRQQKAHRGPDPMVIISLTRQLENDWSVIATNKGYGIGFLNELNFNKSQWVEENYGKKIFNMTSSEKEFALKRIGELSTAAIK